MALCVLDLIKNIFFMLDVYVYTIKILRGQVHSNPKVGIALDYCMSFIGLQTVENGG